MQTFDIYADSSVNLPDEYLEKYRIGVIAYSYLMNGELHYTAQAGVPFRTLARKFYDALRAGGEAKTSLVSKETFKEAVEPSLKAGRDVLLVTIASGISGTYAEAVKAQKELEALYPERTIVVRDSNNASLGEGLLVLHVAQLREQGAGLAACTQWFDENCYKLNSYVTVDDLKYLRKSGRVSAILAFAGNLLNIKPLIHASGDSPAKLTMYGKERGRRRSLAALLSAFDELTDTVDQTVAIAHADCEEDARTVEAMLRERGVKDIVIEYYDICTAAHVGPGTLALFFLGKDRRLVDAPETRRAAVKAKPVKV